MRTILIAIALAVVQVGSGAAQYGAPGPGYPQGGWGSAGRPPAQGYGLRGWGYTPQVQVWVEGDRGSFRRGDRLRAAFSSSADAYVAVVHIDPDGRLEFLYPSSPWDAEYVAGGRSYPIPYRNVGGQGWLVRSSAGVGYLYVIASPVPLDYSRFRGRSAGAWDWSFAGQSVRGDPFWAMEQLTRHLVPDWGYVPIAVDYYSYHVGGVQRYPAYACGGRAGQQSWGWGWGGGYTPSYYGSCDRLDPYLRSYPNYFDAQRYRGDRRAAFRSYGVAAPAHGYKENPTTPRGNTGSTAVPRTTVPTRVTPGSTGRATPAAPSGGGTTEPARRPSLERREPAAEPAAAPARPTTAPPAPTTRRTSGSAAEGSAPSAPAAEEGTGTTEPRRRPTPQ